MNKPSKNPHARRAAAAALVGTVLEWYDFIIYGTAAAIVLNSAFFPSDNPVTGTLAALATYAVGFVARPVGGLVLGRLGDRVGRKRVLVLTLLLMGGATTLIGLLPTYAAIGPLAPALLILLRLVQGFGAGGEYAGAVVLSVEHAEPGRRGLAGSAAPLGFAVGTLLANGVFALFMLMPTSAFEAWGWRIPFLLGAVCVAVGYLVRQRVQEPEAFTAVQESERQPTPLFAAVRRHPRSFFIVIGTRMGENGFAYLFPVFGIAYISTTLGLGDSLGLVAVMTASAVQLATVPLYGWLSDRWGRRPVYAAGAALSLLWLVPFFLLVGTTDSVAVVGAFVVGLGLVYPAMLAPQAAWYAELFDTEFRLTGFAFAREIGSVVAGGLSPFIATALYAWADHWWPIVVYMALLSLITLAALAMGPETAGRGLDHAARIPKAASAVAVRDSLSPRELQNQAE